MKAYAIILALAAILPLTASAADGVTALWDKHCLSCHGKDGSGNTRMGKKAGAKDYRDPKVRASITNDALKNIRDGMTENGKEKMKPLKDKLSDEEIKQLIDYIKTFAKE